MENQKNLNDILKNLNKDDFLLFKGLNDNLEIVFIFVRYNGDKTVKARISKTPYDFEYGYKRYYKCRIEYLINKYAADITSIKKEQNNYKDEIF